MNTALYGCDPKESRIEIIAKWVLTILLALILTLGITSESQAGGPPPEIISSNMVSVFENQTSVLVVETDSSDCCTPLSYSKTGGDDQALFNLDANSGVVSFISAPDFETPLDTGSDNNYEIQVTVEDIFGSDSQNIFITVTDVDDNTGPTITSSNTASVPENQTSALDVQSSDDIDGESSGLSYSKTGGADQALFNLDASTGVLSFISAPDFETPLDAGADNNYDTQVTVTDSGGLTDVQDIVVTVTDVDENTGPTITSNNTASVPENQTSVIDVQSIDDSDSEEGCCESGGLSYSKTGGADQALFNLDAISGIVSFISAPDFETPLDAGAGNGYEIQVTVTDSGGLTDVQDIVVTVTDVDENTAPTITSSNTASVPENQTSVIDVQSSDDSDSEGSGLSYRITGGADQALFNLDANTGVLSFISAPDFETPQDVGGDNNYDIQVTVTDSNGLTDVQDIVVTVADDSTENGLIAHWLLDEGNGTIANDNTGNGHDGTLINDPAWNGNELLFDGANDYVNVGSVDVTGNALTLMGWAQSNLLENCPFRDCRILSKASGNGAQQHYWMLSTIKVGTVTRLRFRLKAGGTTSTLIASSGDISNDELFHAAAVYDGTTMRLYKNGVEVGSLAKTGTIAVNSGIETWIGSNPPNASSRPWSGLLADVRVYQKALTITEVNTVKENYNTDDVTAPVLSNIQVIETDTTAIISWNTNEFSDSTVNYGVDNTYGATQSEMSLVSSHSITLTGLTADTDYHFEVVSSDANSNSSTSADQNFTTATTADSTLPIVSAVNVVVTDSTAVITWTTDKPSTGEVDYGLNNSYGSSAADTNTALLTMHTVILSGLTADTDYHYDLLSIDASSNINLPVDRTFTTDVDTGTGTGGDLIAHWLLDEGTGTNANDASGNGHNGTLLNGPAWFGNELWFDGANDYVNVGTLDATGNALTLMGWAQSDSLENCPFRDCRILSKATGNGSQQHYWMLSTIKVGTVTRLRFRLKAGGTTSTLIASSGDISNDELFHAAATYDGTTMRLYKNGLEVGSLAKIGTIAVNNSVEAWIGSNPPNASSRPWSGLLADVRVYQIALTATEVNTVKDSYNNTDDDLTAPVLSNINVIVTDSTAVITWTTNEPSTGEVDYGLDNSYGSSAADTNTALVATHTVILSGLTADTDYHFSPLSVDAFGNISLPADQTFTTDVDTGTGTGGDLIAHWLLDEGTGTNANDASGNGHDGTLLNGPVWIGNELWFDGANDYVNVGTLDVTGNALTLMGWAQSDLLENCSSRDCRILSKANGNGAQQHYWMLSTIKVGTVTRLRFRLKAGGTTSTLIASSGDINNDELFHAAATYDGTTMRLYKNGLEVGSLAKTGTIAVNNSIEAWIGSNPANASSRPWSGLLADVRVYQTALTATEVNTAKDSYNNTDDITAPVISDINVVITQDFSSNIAVITWTTDEPSTGEVNYGLDNSYGSTAADTNTALDTTHTVILNGLTPFSEYHFNLLSTDEFGNISLPTDRTFFTIFL